MEEKKLNNTAKMQALHNEKSEEKTQKLSYEQLNDACTQLYQQNQNLVRQLQQMNHANMFKRLDYLFKVLDYNKLFPEEFVSTCIAEIQEAIIIPPEDSQAGNKDNN